MLKLLVCLALLLLASVDYSVPACATEPTTSSEEPPKSNDVGELAAETRAWIEQFDDDSFRVRERAEQQFKGLAAVDRNLIQTLGKLDQSDNAESRIRARRVLEHWADNATIKPEDEVILARLVGAGSLAEYREMMATKWLERKAARYQKGDPGSTHFDRYDDSQQPKPDGRQLSEEELFDYLSRWQDAQDQNGPEPEFSRRLLGAWQAYYMGGWPEGDSIEFEFVKLTDRDADSFARALARVTYVENIQFYDQNEISLKAMAALQYSPAPNLSLQGKHVTDEMLIAIGKMRSLKDLDLWSTSVTDAGLAHLAPLNKLRRLGISSTQIDGSGLAHLIRCRDLR